MEIRERDGDTKGERAQHETLKRHTILCMSANTSHVIRLLL